MSAALALEAGALAVILREAATMSDAQGLSANARRYQMAADMIASLCAELSDVERLRVVEAAALRVASSRRGDAVSDRGALDRLDAALESRP